MKPVAATFSGFRMVAGRKVFQLLLEIPIEEANTALATLGGIPDPANPVWVAIAPLTGPPKAPASEPDHRRRWEELPATQQAAIRCQEPAFQHFLGVEDAEHAALAVRHLCQVKSRKELNQTIEAAKRWENLDDEFQKSRWGMR
jgi:hypothetical protein